VQFASHSEALAAIRSTEAVLNNRFIKVFWHSKEQQQVHDINAGPNKSEQTDNSNNTISSNMKMSIKDQLGPKVAESTESVLTAVNSSGTISRTVFDPSKLKKTNNNNSNTSSTIPEENASSQTNKDPKSKTLQKTQKQIAVYSQQQKLLQDWTTYLNQLTNKLEKTTNDNDKKNIKSTISDLMNKIQDLNESIKKSQSDMLAKRAINKVQTKEELLEDFLNTDLEMYIKMQNNDLGYIESANKCAKLKKKLKSLGVTNFRSAAKPFTRRGRGRAGAGRGGYHSRGALSVDRRTRKILIPDINEDDITDLLEHLAVSFDFY